MVDSIRQAGRIGAIKPPGQPRPVEERNPSRHGRHDQGRDESQADRQGAPPEASGSYSGAAPGGHSEPAAENEDRPPTGHRIDVRI